MNPRITPSCLACGASAPRSAVSIDASPGGEASTICAPCWEQIRNREQPIGGYRIIKKLSEGNTGAVQLAWREADNSLVALKTIIPAVAGSQSKVERFLREADILRSLRHPNVVGCCELGEFQGQLYFTREYVPGTDAARLLEESGGTLEIARAVGLVCQVLNALEYVHTEGVVHRNIQPGNLIVTEKAGQEFVKLIDFGMALNYRIEGASGGLPTGDFGGTLAFVAPEQITRFREPMPSADLYAAAATLYGLLTGRFTHDLPRAAEERLLMILTEEAMPIQRRRADIPDELAAVIHRALCLEPEGRFADARTLRQALAPFGK